MARPDKFDNTSYLCIVNISLKYELLGAFEQKEVNDFIEFLLSKRRSKDTPVKSGYRDNLLNIGAWSEDDLKIFKENASRFNDWHPETG